MDKKKIPWLISGALVVVLVAGGVWYTKAKNASAAPSNFITGTVKRANVNKRVDATGTIQVPTQYNLSFNAKGKITQINVKVGDHVKAGQVLAQIDQTAVNQTIAQAKNQLTSDELALEKLKSPSQADLLNAEKFVAQAQAQLDRDQANPQIQQSQINSDKVALDSANAQLAALKNPSSLDLESLQIKIANDQSNLAIAQDSLNDTVIKAPVDGTVTAVNGQVGEYPGGSSGSSSGSSSGGLGGQGGSSGSQGSSSAVITLVADSSTLQVVVPVDEADIGNVQTGQPAEVTVDAYPDKVFKGTVSQVSPTGNTQNGVTTFNVTVDVPYDSALKPGMSADVSIIVAQKQNVLTVPSMAVHENGSTTTVLLAPAAGSTRPISQQVTIGIDDGTNAEVVQGLQEGDKVVIGFRAQSSSTQRSGSFFGMGGNRSGFGGMGGFGGGNRGSYGGNGANRGGNIRQGD